MGCGGPLGALRALALAAGGACLAACSTQAISPQVSAYSAWGAGQHGGTYAFERLPSQAAQGNEQGRIEAAAEHALAGHGLQKVAQDQKPQYTVELMASTHGRVPSPQVYPPYWRPGWGAWRRPFGWGYPWDPADDPRRVMQEVRVVLRDRASHEVRYETHAGFLHFGSEDASLWPALFEAALQEYPLAQPEAHTVTVELQPLRP